MADALLKLLDSGRGQFACHRAEGGDILALIHYPIGSHEEKTCRRNVQNENTSAVLTNGAREALQAQLDTQRITKQFSSG